MFWKKHKCLSCGAKEIEDICHSCVLKGTDNAFRAGYQTAKRESDMRNQAYYNAYYKKGLEDGKKFLSLSPKIVKHLITLCHPDKHGNSKLSNEVTKWLLQMRKK